MIRFCCSLFVVLSIASFARAAEVTLDSVDYAFADDHATITVKANDAAAFAGMQIMIDTDNDPATGFAASDEAKGFEVMIEGATLYAHGGAAVDWTWNRTGEANRAVEGNTATITLPKSTFKAKSVRLYTRLLTPDWQKVIATDKAGVVTLALDSKAPAAPIATAAKEDKAGKDSISIEDKAGDATDPSTDLTSLQAKRDGAKLVVTLQTKAVSKFETVLLFIDADADGKTGYQPPADAEQGFDLLVQGDDVFRFQAKAARGAWAWDKVGAAKRSVADKTLTITLDAKLITGNNIGLSAWYMSADFQTALDRIPDAGVTSMKLSAADALPAADVPVAIAEPRPNRALPIRERVAKAANYYCYYGSGKVAELSHYDVAILHSPEFKSPDIAKLNELGVVTVGYLSIGEDDQLRTGNGQGPGGKASWYFDSNHDSVPDQNGIWKSWYANASDPAWRADRVAEAKRLVEQEGYEGIFLDTIDTASLHPESKEKMAQLVRELREALPGKAIVLNQGFDILADVAEYADALMLESFTLTYDFDSKTYMRNFPQSIDFHLRRINNVIKPVIAKHPLTVFVLDYAKPDQADDLQAAADRCKTLGLLFSAAPIFLDEVYTGLPEGHTDPKWTLAMASPESMSYTLAEDRNGFAAGTKFLPNSCFAGYTIDPVVDGITDRAKLGWAKAAWASGEDEIPAVLEIRFPKPIIGGTLKINWHDEAGPSRKFTIETQQNGTWKVASDVTHNGDVISHHALPKESIEAIRVTQPPGGGSTGRPNLMWIAQMWLEK